MKNIGIMIDKMVEERSKGKKRQEIDEDIN